MCYFIGCIQRIFDLLVSSLESQSIATKQLLLYNKQTLTKQPNLLLLSFCFSFFFLQSEDVAVLAYVMLEAADLNLALSYPEL